VRFSDIGVLGHEKGTERKQPLTKPVIQIGIILTLLTPCNEIMGGGNGIPTRLYK
jgi:hypothetical protein